MRKMEQKIEIIEQLDWLIRLGETGTPKQLAKKLEISEAFLFQILGVMKQLNAPILFDIALQSYIYEASTNFTYGHYARKLYKEEIEMSSSSVQNIMISVDFKYPNLRKV